jgi:uncharacterized protein (DUF1697 family)
MRWAVLLRGLNIGGKRLPMPELTAFLESLGHRDVRTLLASGNAVMTADETDAAALEARLETAAAQRLSLATDWLVRSHADLAAVLAANPFPDAATERPSRLLVHFHRDPAPPPPAHDGPERTVAIGRELYVDYAGGVGASTLDRTMRRARWPMNTARNWNTVAKLADLTG